MIEETPLQDLKCRPNVVATVEVVPYSCGKVMKCEIRVCANC